MKEEITIALTKSQCENLAEFIESHLLREIREDVDIDNITWLCEMCESYKILTKAYKGE